MSAAVPYLPSVATPNAKAAETPMTTNEPSTSPIERPSPISTIPKTSRNTAIASPMSPLPTTSMPMDSIVRNVLPMSAK